MMDGLIAEAIAWAGVCLLAYEAHAKLTPDAKAELRQACKNQVFRDELVKELRRLGLADELGLDTLPA